MPWLRLSFLFLFLLFLFFFFHGFFFVFFVLSLSRSPWRSPLRSPLPPGVLFGRVLLGRVLSQGFLVGTITEPEQKAFLSLSPPWCPALWQADNREATSFTALSCNWMSSPSVLDFWSFRSSERKSKLGAPKLVFWYHRRRSSLSNLRGVTKY